MLVYGWNLKHELDWLTEIVGRFHGKGHPEDVKNTRELFGTAGKFINQYLSGLQRRVSDFSGKGDLSNQDRITIFEHIDGLRVMTG